MKLRRTIAVGILLLSAGATDARAQDAAACKDGYTRSQDLRDNGKLVAARALLQQCSSATCSKYIQQECVAWLQDVEARLPSVILAAKDDAGNDIVDITAAIDGGDSRKLDGREIDIDPGEHLFVFSKADGTKNEQRIIIRERERGKVIAATFKAAAPPDTTAPPAAQTAPSSADKGAAGERPPPYRTMGYAIGGVGVVGVAIGSVFGVLAANQLSGHCDSTTKLCDPGTVSSTKTQATVSTTGFIVGGVFLAGGVALVLFGPKSSPATQKAAVIQAAPVVGRDGGGFALQGAF
jgi:hypothetical protein